MIAFACARDHGARIDGAVVMNTVIPGLDPWAKVLADPHIFHFALHNIPDLPELLVTGHERRYFDLFYDMMAANPQHLSDAARFVCARVFTTGRVEGWLRLVPRHGEGRRAQRPTHAHRHADALPARRRRWAYTGRLRGRFAPSGCEAAGNRCTPGQRRVCAGRSAGRACHCAAPFPPSMRCRGDMSAQFALSISSPRLPNSCCRAALVPESLLLKHQLRFLIGREIGHRTYDRWTESLPLYAVLSRNSIALSFAVYPVKLQLPWIELSITDSSARLCRYGTGHRSARPAASIK
jgi:hypothetical protein